MPGAHWRSRRGVATRERVLELGAKYLSAHGVAGVSIRAIADGASVTSAAIHYHFRTQEGFVQEVIRRWDGEVRRTVESAAMGLRGLRRVAAMAGRWIELADVRPVLAEVIRPFDGSAGYDGKRAAMVEVVKGWTAMTRRALSQARALGELREGTDARKAAFELHALIWSQQWAADVEGQAWTTRVLRELVWSRLSVIALDPAATLPRQDDFVGPYDAGVFDDDDGFVPRGPNGRVPLWYEIGSRLDPEFHALLRHARQGDVRDFAERPPVLPEDVTAAEDHARRHPEEVAEQERRAAEYQRTKAAPDGE